MVNDTSGVGRQYWLIRSRAFIRVAARHRNLLTPHSFERAVSLWCANQPCWYQQWIFSQLQVSRADVPAVAHSSVSSLIREFTSRLCRAHRSVIFLMNDASPLAEAFEASGGKAILVGLSRQSLPQPADVYYLDLFDIVNRAALSAMTHPRRSFLTCYRTALKRYLTKTPVMAELIEREAHLLINTSATAVVDTGMQGTFAFALASIVEKLTNRRLEVHLAVAYPWLFDLLEMPAISYDARSLVSLEAMARKFGSKLYD